MAKPGIESQTEHQHHETSDPVLSMLGLGKHLWEREPGDCFVARLRSEEAPPSPFAGASETSAQDVAESDPPGKD